MCILKYRGFQAVPPTSTNAQGQIKYKVSNIPGTTAGDKPKHTRKSDENVTTTHQQACHVLHGYRRPVSFLFGCVKASFGYLHTINNK